MGRLKAFSTGPSVEREPAVKIFFVLQAGQDLGSIALDIFMKATVQRWSLGRTIKT